MARFMTGNDRKVLLRCENKWYEAYLDRIKTTSDPDSTEISLSYLREVYPDAATERVHAEPATGYALDRDGFVTHAMPAESNGAAGTTNTPGGDTMSHELETIERELAAIDDERARQERNLAAREARLQARLDEIKRVGEDPFEDGAVIVFDLQFVHDDGFEDPRVSRPYHYAAIRVNGRWNTTGPKSPKDYSWYELMKWIGENQTVDGVWFVKPTGLELVPNVG